MMEISVIVVCWNEAGNIARCLDSLLTQSHPPHLFEIVAVDGGSRDKTGEIIAAYAAIHPRVLLVSEPRKGTAIGRNRGVAAARHPHVAFIDADCEAPPEWLERLSKAFLHHRSVEPAVVAVGGGNVPPPDSTPFVQAVGLAMDSFAGSFNSAQGR
ncbi:glycosyltransferase, partial [Candidatus Magnetominusculus xianensis]|uniref:glycosyltransferase n=1 Tax=Candidatus Magnetominusculus xianensis TaxID=1748249 RepID=UPI0012EE4558